MLPLIRRTGRTDGCGNVVLFRTDEGRKFFFAYADGLRRFRGDDPIQLGHSRDGGIWFVRQGTSMVASYDEVRELRNQNIRLGRFLALLGCLGIVVFGGRIGVLRASAHFWHVQEPEVGTRSARRRRRRPGARR